MFDKKIVGYRRAFERYGINPKALQWTSKEAQEIRFRELLADLDLEGKSILDVGCGFGDIIPFIQRKAKRFSYTGVDLVPEFIKVARKKYPNHRFLVTDYFEKPLEEKYDIIITSGTLNANIEEPLTFRKRAIRILFEKAKEAVIFNMAGGYAQPRNKRKFKVYYANSLKVLKFCLTLTSKIIFRHHYRKKDFTVVMFK